MKIILDSILFPSSGFAFRIQGYWLDNSILARKWFVLVIEAHINFHLLFTYLINSHFLFMHFCYFVLFDLIVHEEEQIYICEEIFHRETYAEREKGETPNDRNDRAIRLAARYLFSYIAVLVFIII